MNEAALPWLIAGSLLPALLVSAMSGTAVRRWAPRWGLIDRPSERKNHGRAVPTGGGLAIWLGVVGPLAAAQLTLWLLIAGILPADRLLPEPLAVHLPGLWQRSAHLWALLAGGTALMIVGLVDDRRGLHWSIRLAAQTLVAVVMVLLGWRLSLFVELPWLTGTLSVLWIVGLTNSFNMLDNMDGLSAGVAAIAAGILAAVMLGAPDPAGGDQPQLFVGGFLLVLVGSLLGFLLHNRPPARLFMGDGGSYLVGYLIAMATLTATFAGASTPRHAILAPLCVLAVPLYDTATVVMIRLRAGRSPFSADRRHFSHRLVELGMSRGQAVATIYLATATCGLGALLLRQVDTSGAVVVLLLVGCVLLLVGVLETAGRRR